jgi:enoyl-CoA hydratase/carnithine racemase
MTYQFILVTKTEHVTTITLNRPEVMNALHAQMHVELEQALDAYAADVEQRVCVITGAGERAFCAGSDLKAAALSSATGGAVGGLGAGKYPRTGYAGLIERYDLHKPVIAAVNGVAMGGGFEIALACDLVVASENAVFGLPEPLVGAVALGGGVHRLARQIGLKQALGMILTGRKVSAREGLALGFVNDVVAPGKLLASVDRWSQQIIACSPIAIEASKQAVYRGLDETSLADAIRNQKGYEKFAEWLKSDDIREGPLAFSEKRKPNWTKQK